MIVPDQGHVQLCVMLLGWLQPWESPSFTVNPCHSWSMKRKCT